MIHFHIISIWNKYKLLKKQLFVLFIDLYRWLISRSADSFFKLFIMRQAEMKNWIKINSPAHLHKHHICINENIIQSKYNIDEISHFNYFMTFNSTHTKTNWFHLYFFVFVFNVHAAVIMISQTKNQKQPKSIKQSITKFDSINKKKIAAPSYFLLFSFK